MEDDGLISKIFTWFTHASYDESTTKQWLLGLALVLVFAFLWSTVIKQVVETTTDVIGDTLT